MDFSPYRFSPFEKFEFANFQNDQNRNWYILWLASCKRYRSWRNIQLDMDDYWVLDLHGESSFKGDQTVIICNQLEQRKHNIWRYKLLFEI
jgi:hypothetical protein